MDSYLASDSSVSSESSAFKTYPSRSNCHDTNLNEGNNLPGGISDATPACPLTSAEVDAWKCTSDHVPVHLHHASILQRILIT